MRIQVVILSAVKALGFMIGASAAAFAQTDLGNTSWSSSPDTGCGIDITFNSDGSASVSESHFTVTHGDTAHWTLDGDALRLKYDTWYGGIDGTIRGRDAIYATEMYQDADSGDHRARSCFFKKEQAGPAALPFLAPSP